MISLGNIGIMQGRLVPPETDAIQSFPRNRWRDEFELASRVGITAIEWIYDSYGVAANPLNSHLGIKEIRGCIHKTGIQVPSLCADYFMECPFVRANPAARTERLTIALGLLRQAVEIGIGRIVLPFVDQSAIISDQDELDVVESVSVLLPEAERLGLELHLETSLPPDRFSALLGKIDHPRVKVNYDSGNSASLGYNVRDEFSAYGSRIGSVHIKDRIKGGGTVPLGEGSVDFDLLFAELSRVSYCGDIVLQVARGQSGDELAYAARNLSFVSGLLADRTIE